MGFQRMKCALKHEVRSKKNKKLFEAARKRQPALARHETVMAVLGVLADESPKRYDEKEALTRALVQEHQERPHPFWGSVLLLSYSPMLCRLRGRIYGDAFPSDELDQLVVASFLETADECPLERWRDRVCLRLRQATERRLFSKIREEQKIRDSFRLAESDDDLEADQRLEEEGFSSAWPETRRTARLLPDPRETAALVAFLVKHAGDAIEPGQLDLVIATLVRGERLSAYVKRVHPEMSGDEQRRTYQRIKRRHSRTLARLRKLLAHLRCPRNTPCASLSSQGRWWPEGGEDQ